MAKKKPKPNKKSSPPKKAVSKKPESKYLAIKRWWGARRIWQKALILLVLTFILFLGNLYVMSLYYRWKHQDEPLNYGVTFSAPYSRYLGVDPKETLDALINDMGIKNYRLMSYWSNIEPTKGTYDFKELDWQFDAIEKSGGTVSLAIGLRQPRWPECHAPKWAKDQPVEAIYPELEKYIGAVVERYKDRPSLKSYQLENEYFLEVFGTCTDYSKERLIKEYDFVKQKDPNTPIIVSLSNNYLGIPVGDPRPDQFGVSVYKRVYDATVTKRYFEYPFTPWYYGGRAGWTELLTGRSSMLHELQAEPWAPMPLVEASIEEQNKSMDAERLAGRIQYGEATGFRDIYLWGGEWWYWRKVKFNDPSLWNVVKQELEKAQP
ncbi:beta-galactosidase [Candidatus Saccharibacteria bacterium]|nr:beta-galactosidase [Candidatus Saccharibacteria bacterium]